MGQFHAGYLKTAIRIALVSIVLTPAQPTWAAGELCRNIFTLSAMKMTAENNAKKMSEDLGKKLPWAGEWAAQSVQIRISPPAENGSYRTLNTYTFTAPLLEGTHTATAYYFSDVNSGSVFQEPIGALSRYGLKIFNSAKNRAITYVLNTYRERRQHWSPEFLAKLKQMATDWAPQSVYLNIENNPATDLTASGWQILLQPKLIGSMRLIEERDGHVPMEDYLEIRVKTEPDIIKIEPGNFAINADTNDVVWAELAIHLLTQMQRYRTERGRRPLFITYADRFSERLYGALGFKYLDPEKIESVGAQTILDGNIVRIEKNGVKWAPMYATEEMFAHLLQGQLKRLSERQASPRLLGKLEEMVSKSKERVIEPPAYFTGMGKVLRNGRPASNETVQRLFVKRHDTALGDHKAYLYLQSEFEFRRDSMRARDPLYVPYPLENNWSETNSDGGTISYMNGILKKVVLRQDTGRTEIYEIAIDKTLTHPKWARMTILDSGNVTEDVRVAF